MKVHWKEETLPKDNANAKIDLFYQVFRQYFERKLLLDIWKRETFNNLYYHAKNV